MGGELWGWGMLWEGGSSSVWRREEAPGLGGEALRLTLGWEEEALGDCMSDCFCGGGVGVSLNLQTDRPTYIHIYTIVTSLVAPLVEAARLKNPCFILTPKKTLSNNYSSTVRIDSKKDNKINCIVCLSFHTCVQSSPGIQCTSNVHNCIRLLIPK